MPLRIRVMYLLAIAVASLLTVAHSRADHAPAGPAAQAAAPLARAQ